MARRLLSAMRGLLVTLRPVEDNPAVVRAQFREFATKIPLLQIIVLTNAASLAYTHYRLAPTWLTVYTLVFLSAIVAFRLFHWLNYGSRLPSLEEIGKERRKIVIFTMILGVGFSLWGYELFLYGDDLHRAHVAFFMSITVISAVVCLMHLPLAALGVIVTATVALLLFIVQSGNSVLASIAINFALVTIVLVLILLRHNRSFNEVVLSRQKLREKNLETERLSKLNADLALIDGLTGLGNRRHFLGFISEIIAARQRESKDTESFVIGLVDLDGFRPINDIHGHLVGDAVLVEVGARLKWCVDSHSQNRAHLCARLDGDEFALVIDAAMSESEIYNLSKEIATQIQLPFKTRSGVVRLSGSCGFSQYPYAGSDADELMDKADFALHYTKGNRRGLSMIFSGEHEELIKRKALIEQAIRESTILDQLKLFYQPIYDGLSNRVTSLEALARWPHATAGNIPPDQFIDIAEKVGKVGDITKFLFGIALRDMERLQPDLGLSFNLSVHDITNMNMLLALYKMTQKYKVEPARIQFEVTETTMMQDIGVCARNTQQLRDLGFRIAIDDFGSGYSSLSYIHKLSFDTLKIDRNFIVEMVHNQRSRGILKAIMDLCLNLGVDCVAEGIETEQQKSVLLAMGCQKMQGFFYCKPASLEELISKSIIHDPQFAHGKPIRKIPGV